MHSFTVPFCTAVKKLVICAVAVCWFRWKIARMHHHPMQIHSVRIRVINLYCRHVVTCIMCHSDIMNTCNTDRRACIDECYWRRAVGSAHADRGVIVWSIFWPCANTEVWIYYRVTHYRFSRSIRYSVKPITVKPMQPSLFCQWSCCNARAGFALFGLNPP